MLEQIVLDRLRDQYEQLLEKGELPSRDKLREYYANFADRFAPDKLLQLDGEKLLTTMHAHGNRDSLVYWLEFKNDEEFPEFFGSIAGGSALKFGIYRKKETGAWMTGSPSDQKEIPIEKAIQIARSHRDQLVAGVRVLEELSPETSDQNYATLQDRLNQEAPEVGNTAWGHKYFSVIFPSKLDDYRR
jgi:5-methylcytosine-specific restriction enzyme B